MANKRVVIIGAGISGLGAAERLLERGITDIVILEATERAGGRIKSLYLTQDDYKYVLEIGAGWIHGVKGNPVHQLAKKHRLLVPREPYKKQEDPRLAECKLEYRNANGDIIPKKIWSPVLAAYDEVMEEAESYYEKGTPDWLDKDKDDLGSYMEEEVMKILRAKGELQKKVLNTRLMYEASVSGCDNMNEVSLAYIGSFDELDGSDIFLPNTGYESIIEALKANIPQEKLLLNHVVSNIDYSDDKVTVTCENGAVFTADHVIVTASLGYLKENAASMFTPALPQGKINAIQRLGFDTVNRIYIEFENLDFIPDPEVGEIFVVQDAYTEVTAWEDKLYTFYVQNTPRANVLTTWVTGKQAELLEKESDAEIKAKLKKVLQKFLGVPVPLPIKITKTAWYSEPYVRGSYSFIKVGSSVDDINALAEPIYDDSTEKPQVMFAGEATNDSFYSTTHGALLTGHREADRIADFYSH